MSGTNKDSHTPRSKPSEHNRADGHPAIKSLSAVAVFLAVAGAALAGDLLSKHYVFKSMLSDPRLRLDTSGLAGPHADPAGVRKALSQYQRPICLGVKFTLSTNDGIAFGLPVSRGVVTVTTVLMVLLVFCFFATCQAGVRWVHVALAMIMAGALGNLYDRLFSEVTVPHFAPIRQQVRDFIDCSELHYRYVFNVADSLLVIGVAILILHWLFTSRQDKKAKQAATESSPSAFRIDGR